MPIFEIYKYKCRGDTVWIYFSNLQPDLWVVLQRFTLSEPNIEVVQRCVTMTREGNVYIGSEEGKVYLWNQSAATEDGTAEVESKKVKSGRYQPYKGRPLK